MIGDMRAESCVACDVRPPLKPGCLRRAGVQTCPNCNGDGTRWIVVGTLEKWEDGSEVEGWEPVYMVRGLL